MKINLQYLTVLIAVSFPATVLQSAEIGEPAAPLEIAEWVKGDAVDLTAAKGKKVVVVEFWATWCGPCRTSIPHLTELQKKFRDRGVVVIGVSDEASSKVQPFVDGMGEKMDYTVAIDRDRKTSAGYMAAYGINGIPHAFVVDKEGRIAWHGHPMDGLDKVLEKLATQTFDLAGEKKRDTAQRLLQEYFERAGRGEPDGKLDALGKQLLALDKELGGIEPGEKLDLAELRKLARFQTLMRDYQRALASGKSDAELAQLEAKAKPLAPDGFAFDQFKGQFQLQRVFQDYYRAACGGDSEARTAELANKLAGIKSDNAEMLNEIAWTLLTDEKIKTRDTKLALKFAQAAFDRTGGKDASVLDTYARALFDNGDIKEAIRQQKRALDLTEEPDRKDELEATLKRYQANAVAR